MFLLSFCMCMYSIYYNILILMGKSKFPVQVAFSTPGKTTFSFCFSPPIFIEGYDRGKRHISFFTATIMHLLFFLKMVFIFSLNQCIALSLPFTKVVTTTSSLILNILCALHWYLCFLGSLIMHFSIFLLLVLILVFWLWLGVLHLFPNDLLQFRYYIAFWIIF